MKEPAWHASHAVEPGSCAKYPGLQGEQAEAEALAAKVLTLHGLHCGLPGEAEKVPGWQA